ncbi:hypothetical protein FRB95_012490 [Tulasnella sp. JGI-2019a]|nr:hypothetical protein FRB95_012490 [Tulasnella sp. JGI-2019a]
MNTSPSTWVPKRSVQECWDILTKALGSSHELEIITINGHLQKAYKNIPASLRDFWLDTATRNATKDYIVFEKERYTYDDVLTQSSKLASVLYSVDGVRKGDRVGLVMRNYPEWLVIFWACQLLGAVDVAINPWLPVEPISKDQPGPLTHCITLTECKVLVLDAERATALELWIAQGSSKTGLEGHEDMGISNKCIHGPTDLRKNELNVTLDENSTIFFTSGTTGLPKGVPSTHRHYLSNILNVIATYLFRTLRNGEMPSPPDPQAPQLANLTAGPFFHVNGGLSSVGVATKMGSRLVLMRKWDKELAARLIREEKIESMIGVPFMTLDVADSSLQEHAKTLPAFGFSFGGSPASPAMVKSIMSRFPNAVMSQGSGIQDHRPGRKLRS